MLYLLKLKLPKEIIYNIINYNRYLHEQNIKKVINYNNVLRNLPKINDSGISRPYIIIYSKTIFNNKKLVKFIYKVRNKNIKAFCFVNKNIKSSDLIELYKI